MKRTPLHPIQKQQIARIKCDRLDNLGFVKHWTGHIPALEVPPDDFHFYASQLHFRYPYNRALMASNECQLLHLGWRLDHQVTEAELRRAFEDPTQYWHLGETHVLTIAYADWIAGATCKRRMISTQPLEKAETFLYEFCPQVQP